MNKFKLKPFLVLAMMFVSLVGGVCFVTASDHDDGEIDQKGRSLNLTDLFVFREGDQTGNAADNSNLIFIMNTNPRSVARQQYFFSTRALYEFHVTRQAVATGTATGTKDVTLRFQFSDPDVNNVQNITASAFLDGAEFASNIRSDNGMPIQTTSLANGATPNSNPFQLNGQTLTVFAGMREDPFFFDVESFFRVRANLAGIGPAASFKGTTTAVDFASGYNVNALVVRVPIAFLQGPTTNPVFDVWETISVP